MDPLSQAKFDALDHYPTQDLERLHYSIMDILIDCQHKQWSGVLQSAVISPVTMDGDAFMPNMNDDNDRPDAFAVTLLTKDGREHTAFHDIQGCDSLLCQVKEQWMATMECLDALIPA